MSDFEVTPDELDKAKFDVLVKVITEAVNAFEHSYPSKEDIIQHLSEIALCKTWDDFHIMVYELAMHNCTNKQQ